MKQRTVPPIIFTREFTHCQHPSAQQSTRLDQQFLWVQIRLTLPAFGGRLLLLLVCASHNLSTPTHTPRLSAEAGKQFPAASPDGNSYVFQLCGPTPAPCIINGTTLKGSLLLETGDTCNGVLISNWTSGNFKIDVRGILVYAHR